MEFNVVSLIDDIYIKCPEHISLTKKFPVHDFMLANFSIDGEYFLRAYVGNNPDFPSNTCVGRVEQRKIGGFSGKEIKCGNKDFAFDILVDLNLDWPQYIHFMIRGSSIEHELVGIDVINSVHVK